MEQSGQSEIHNLVKRVHMESAKSLCNNQQIVFGEIQTYDSAEFAQHSSLNFYDYMSCRIARYVISHTEENRTIALEMFLFGQGIDCSFKIALRSRSYSALLFRFQNIRPTQNFRNGNAQFYQRNFIGVEWYFERIVVQRVYFPVRFLTYACTVWSLDLLCRLGDVQDCGSDGCSWVCCKTICELRALVNSRCLIVLTASS